MAVDIESDRVIAAVVAIFAILASLMLPGMSSAKERSRRTACKNNFRQFILAQRVCMKGSEGRNCHM